MKKSLFVVGVAMMSLVLTGCGSKEQKTMTCTVETKDPSNKYVVTGTYKIYYTGDLVDKVTTEEVVSSDDTTVRSTFEETLKSTYEDLNSSYGGYTYTVTNKDNKVTADVTIDYDKMDLSKFVSDNPTMKSFVKNDKLLLSGLKTTYEATGATCK